MTEESNLPASAQEHEQRYHGFWPLLLISGSLVLIFAWEIRVGIFARENAEHLRDQQLRVVDQAKHVQAGLEKLVRGLVDLSATDDAAKKIVTKYGIKIGSNPPAPPASSSP